MKKRFYKCGLTAREHSAEENKPWRLRSNVSLENLVLTQTKGAFQGNIGDTERFSCFAPLTYIGEKA